MGTCKDNPLGGPLFVLTHLKALRSTTSHFPTCLFLTIVDDLGPPSFEIHSTYKYLVIELCDISIYVQPHKCVTLSPFDLPIDFAPMVLFNILLDGIKVLGIPFGFSSFASFFNKIFFLLKTVNCVNFPLRIGDVQMTYGILICYLVQCPSFFL